MRVLIVGASGLLGSTLAPALAGSGFEVVRHGFRGPADESIDLCLPGTVAALLDRVRPHAVVNLAVLSDVDACEREPARADALNRELPARLAGECRSRGTTLVHVSTDQVYSLPGPSPEDQPSPVNTYGRSKLAGDLEAADLGATVLRTNFFGPSRRPGRTSQSDWYLAAFRSGHPVTLFPDIRFSPLRMTTVADRIARVLARPVPGIFNLGARGHLSKLEFGLALARAFGLDASRVVSTPGAALPGRAPRPPDTSMDPTRLESLLGLASPDLAAEIAALPAEYRAAGTGTGA